MGLKIARAIGIRGGLAIILAILAALCWHKWGVWKEKYGVLSSEAGEVLAAVRIASDNPKLAWADTKEQVEALDASLTQWRGTARTQSDLIDTMGRDTERLRAENAVLAAKVAAANKKRDAAIARLQNDALDPGDTADCWAQIREADEALNILYREGF